MVLSSLNVLASQISIFVFNCRIEFDEVSYNYRYVKILHDGTVEWRPGGVYTTLCYIDTTLFPFDVQTCIFEFENWMHSGKKAHTSGSKKNSLELNRAFQ